MFVFAMPCFKSNVLRDLGGRMNMSGNIANKFSTCDPDQIEGYKCQLPVPFVEGAPANYLKMTVDQLRKFINFSYKSQYAKTLPLFSNSRQKLPSWWHDKVTFDKFLKIKPTKILRNKDKFETPPNSVQQKILASLLRDYYEAFGMSTLLQIGCDLAKPSGKRELQLVKGNFDKPWKISDSAGKAILYVDSLSRTYDIPELQRVNASKKCKKNHEHSENSKKGLTRSTKDKTRQNKKTRLAQKRKLFDIEEEAVTEPYSCCQYCGKEFGVKDFLEDHEMQCNRNPRSQVTQLSFMSALGMLKPSDEKTDQNPTDVCVVTQPEQAAAPHRKVGRPIRRATKKNHFLSFMKTPVIPLSSNRGQRLIREFGNRVEYKYPPRYERACQSLSVSTSTTRDFPVVTKRSIEKDRENCHIYTYGRKQRKIRNQEIVIGLYARCWKLLNRCKTPRLRLKRIKAPTVTLKVPPKVTVKVPSKVSVKVPPKSKNFLERNLRGAIKLPRVLLIDVRKHPTAESVRFLKPLKLETERRVSDASTDSSFDSSDLFYPAK